MAETKPKATDSLRTPKPKKKLGLTVPPALRLPHEDLITPQNGIIANIDDSMTSMTSHSSHTSHTQQNTIEEAPVAPQRDYTKVANSISRQAVPAGLFTGKSKQLYDCLYLLTRGAVMPSRTVRISRPKLMEKAHIGSRVTFDANIERLLNVGLIQVRQIVGEHEGNEYSVFLPEEITSSMPSQTSQTSLTDPAQKLDRLVRLETSQTRHTLSALDSMVSDMPKTSFKTNTERSDDDEAFAGFVNALNKAFVEVTGRELSRAEAPRLTELAEVLVTELKIAAARTTVSSAPSFLAEHLRRRLWKLDKRQGGAEAKQAPTEESSALTTAQIKHCPDCGGSGMYYPEGYDKGVAKCKHEKLSRQGKDQNSQS
jgi:hypothetical protein